MEGNTHSMKIYSVLRLLSNTYALINSYMFYQILQEISPDLHGMLGGYERISPIDIESSKKFLQELRVGIS